MKNDIVLKINKIIEILKNNPIIEISEPNNDDTNELSICYCDYPKWVYEIEDLFDAVIEYGDICQKLFDNKKDVSEYSMKEIRAVLTYFVRGERFCDGHMNLYINNGMLFKWLSRYKELLTKEEYK